MLEKIGLLDSLLLEVSNTFMWIFILTLVFLQSIDESVDVTSDEKVCWELSWSWFMDNTLSNFTIFICFLQKEVQRWPCFWNGFRKPCYLFTRKFSPETEESLLKLFSNYSSSWAG